MRRIARIPALSAIALAAIIYFSDGLVFRLRHQPCGSITIQHYFAIRQKTGKVELQYDRAVEQVCANSLFPHSGNKPCWYLKRHTEQWTEI